MVAFFRLLSTVSFHMNNNSGSVVKSIPTVLQLSCLSAQMLDCLPYKSLTPVSPFVFCLPAQMEHDLHFVGFAFSDSGSGLVSTLSEGGWIVEVTFSVLPF